MKKELIKYGLMAALGEAVYVILIALFMQNANQYFGQKPSIFGFAAFLLIFVLSAAISGALVLGKPILLYLENKKKEAVELFFITIIWMLVLLSVLLLLVVGLKA
jgi:uncharacterized membrane protein YbhN (UPF0104 family)